MGHMEGRLRRRLQAGGVGITVNFRVEGAEAAALAAVQELSEANSTTIIKNLNEQFETSFEGVVVTSASVSAPTVTLIPIEIPFERPDYGDDDDDDGAGGDPTVPIVIVLCVVVVLGLGG